MNRELTRREVYLLLVAPSLLIVLIYWFGVESPRQTAVDLQSRFNVQQRQHLDQLRAGAAQVQNNLREQQRRVASLNEQLASEKRLAAVQAHPALLIPSWWTVPADRIEALAAVTSVFDSHGLEICSRKNEGGASGLMPKPLRDFALAVQHDGNHPAPELWRIECVGSYAQLLAALHDLAQHDNFIVPVAISMQPQEGDLRTWTLWLWI